jgi:predicted alpha/beta-hydrolase family hydrolase
MIALASQLKKFPVNTKITLIGRSAGAILATKVSLEFPIQQIICLGYPFKHPEKAEETYRFEHLAHVNTPTLIIQGERDAYGGREILEKYPMNTSIQIIFEDLDHDFTLTEETRLRLIKLIKERLM